MPQDFSWRKAGGYPALKILTIDRNPDPLFPL